MKCLVPSQIFAKGLVADFGVDLCIKVTLLQNARVVLGLGGFKGCLSAMPL